MTLPNQLTILRIFLSPVFLFLFLQDEPLLKQISLIVFIIAALSDWYDGWLARKFNYITEWGKFMDPLADKFLTSVGFLGLVFVGLLELWMVIIIIIRDFSVTLLRIYADKKEFAFVTSYYAKWKTMLQMTFLYYLLILYVADVTLYLGEKHKDLFNILLNKYLVYYVMLLITFITLHTGYVYVRKNISLIKKIFTR
ncbi:CDP-diacylglycerol--glycerol-3-phosphate 3-phosphatidyltransferase [bacterium BMS3Abin03]|jgi:CDP-diacylglycerol---glycerol-3-phosphate 3-phosphatidyltransferase|nr:CDP-diacylglycerol--glycerol-3-phosphate 3-phosphatidyltransferase [bacterium BMS3Abin03]MCG6960824.1 CDP-diacylglycerol--glycerol-3-phosphate 3-phosphatidyltransferase [bacterium BMS3Abin03]